LAHVNQTDIVSGKQPPAVEFPAQATNAFNPYNQPTRRIISWQS